MSKKDFIEKMQRNAKALFKADHIKFKEYKGYSAEGFNYALEIANYTERNINVQYFYFRPSDIKDLKKDEPAIATFLYRVMYGAIYRSKEKSFEQKIIENILITPFTERYVKEKEPQDIKERKVN